MNVTAVSVPDAASDPAHPDHDRWVKETTLRMEVENAKRLGIPLAHAEAENQRLLERAARIAGHKPASLTKKTKGQKRNEQQEREFRKSRLDRLAERAVSIKAAEPLVHPFKLSPCGRCGTCRACMRERRVVLIIEKSKQGDLAMRNLAFSMAATAIDAQGGAGRFAGMSKEDRNRIVTAKAEMICDQSVRWLGKWI